MSTSRDEILRELGQKMLFEIDDLANRLTAEKAALLEAARRIPEIDARLAILAEERARLVARGQSRAPIEDGLIADAPRAKVAK